MTILHKKGNIYTVAILEKDIMLLLKRERNSFIKALLNAISFFCNCFKKNSSAVIQYSPGGRMLLSLELDNMSSSGISGAVVSFRPDVVGSSMRGAFVFGGSASVLLQAHLLAFFGL